MRFLLTLIGAIAIHGAAAAACPPAGVTRSELAELRAAEFEVADHVKRRALAIGLVGCLADRDQELRGFCRVSGVWPRKAVSLAAFSSSKAVELVRCGHG